MLDDLYFYDYVKVFLITAVFGILLIGLIDGTRNIKKTGQGEKANYKTKIIDFIFGVDIFLMAWFGVSFSTAFLAGLIGGSYAALWGVYPFLFVPPVIVLSSAILFFLEPMRKYKYIFLGAFVAGGIATFSIIGSYGF